MEKLGATNEYDVRNLIKRASDTGKVVVLNMDGFMKQSDGKKGRKALVLFATGDNADKLRQALGDLLE